MRFILSCLLLIGAHSLLAEPLLQFAVSADHSDNLNNAEHSADKQADGAVLLQLEAGCLLPLPDDATLLLAATLDAEQYQHIEGLNHYAAGALASYTYKLGLGRNAQRLSAALSSAHASYRDDSRDGWLYAANIALSQRIADRWELAATYRFDRTDSDSAQRLLPGLSGAVFDQNANSLGIDATFFYSDVIALNIGYTHRDGDITATTPPSRSIYAASRAIAEDEVFGDEFYAYRIAGVTHIFSLLLSASMSDRSSLNLSYRHSLSAASGDFNYTGNSLSAGWLYRY